jgi:NADH-quinone oxidoreductase subunit J
MLIGSEKIETSAGHRMWTPYVGILLGVLLLSSMIYAFADLPADGTTASSTLQGGDPVVLGELLFTRYILPIEMTAVLLLVALLGALLLARHSSNSSRDL